MVDWTKVQKGIFLSKPSQCACGHGNCGAERNGFANYRDDVGNRDRVANRGNFDNPGLLSRGVVSNRGSSGR